MKTSVFFTEAAEHDLVDIGVYTWQEWGELQFQKYLALLADTCEHVIPSMIKHARSVPQRSGLLRWPCEHHHIYFRKVPGGIEIVRILHERMAPLKHL